MISGILVCWISAVLRAKRYIYAKFFDKTI